MQPASTRGRRRPYVGVALTAEGKREYHLIMSASSPRAEEYPNVGYVVGPFHTKRDAIAYVTSGDAWNRPTPNSLSYRAPIGHTFKLASDTLE